MEEMPPAAALGPQAANPLKLIARLSNCVELDLSGIISVDDSAIEVISGGCSKLHELYVAGCYRITDAGLGSIGLNSRRLRVLDVRCNKTVTHEGIKNLIEGL